MRARATRIQAAITGTSAKTLLQVYAANSNRPLRIVKWGISFTGVDNLGTPVRVQLVKQTTAGTGGGTNTPVKKTQTESESIEATAIDDTTAITVEPTSSDIYDEQMVHPQGGYEAVETDPEKFKVGGGDRIAVFLPEGVPASVDGVAWIEWDE